MRVAITERKEWKFFSVLLRAGPSLVASWWAGLILPGLLPAAFAVTDGHAVPNGQSFAMPLYGVSPASGILVAPKKVL